MPYTDVFQQVVYKTSKTSSSILIHNSLTVTKKQSTMAPVSCSC